MRKNSREITLSWKKNWIEKAKEHFEAGKVLYEKGLYRDSLARLYYCAYSLMVAECGEAPTGRWEHKGILKYFFEKLYKKNKSLDKTERGRLKDFYEQRRVADYELYTIEKEEVEAYINLVEKLFEVINDD